MRFITLFYVIFFIFFNCAHAQDRYNFKGGLIYTLGKDTSAVGNYQLNGNDFSLTVVSIIPSITVCKLKGSFFPGGTLKYVEGYNYTPLKDSQSVITSYKLFCHSDTSYLETKRGNKIHLNKYPVRLMVANSIGGDAMVFMLPLLAKFAPVTTGDSIVSNHIVFNSARKFTLKRTGENKVILGSAVMGMFTVNLDRSGQLTSVDGIGTSFNIKGSPCSYFNLDSVIKVEVARQIINPVYKVINKLDSVTTIIDGTNVKLIYSRPSVRGREIFGQVVPWNHIWRTGADAATKISFSNPVIVNGKKLPAGSYSIFTRPTQHGWTLIFNKQANIWGTEYNANFDELSVPMQTKILPAIVELMTIKIQPTDKGGGSINVSWDKLEASVKFNIVN